jgi:6-phospho-beta-glucosidase
VTQFPLDELWLSDVDEERLQTVGRFGQRMTEARGAPFRVVLTTDQQSAVKDAAYVITQLRVGQMEARRHDEYLGQRHGLIGQETTGVGGMAKALRTIPVILQIARDVQALARPDALLVNFANPAGLVTQALSQYAADTPAVGVCNVPITAKMMMLERLQEELGKELDPDQVKLDTLGLNHLSWHRGLTIEGESVWPQVMQATLADLQTQEHPEWDPRTIEVLQMIPNYYLQYFYYTEKKLTAQQNWPPSRAEEVIEIEKNLLAQYADPEMKEPPADLMQRGGAWYSTVASQLLAAHYNDLGQRHIVNVKNDGAVREWPIGWVLEMPAIVRKVGMRPIPAQPMPPALL